MQQKVHSERMSTDGNTGYAVEYIMQKIFVKKKKKKKKEIKRNKPFILQISVL